MTLRFDVVGIVAADMARSLDFYRTLGLDVPAGSDELPHVECPLPGGIRMTWDTPEVIRSFDPDWSMPREGGHSLSIAFACDQPAEVDEVYARLVAAGYHGHLPPWDAFWGHRYATLNDPDGNSVDLFADLPTE